MEEPPGLQAGSLWERYRSLLTVMLILATVGGAAVFLFRRPEPVTIMIIPPGPTATPAPSPTPGPIAVYVTGAVANPETIVSLPYGSRAIDAIEAAGGFAAGADRLRVNQAQLLHDGDQVHVFSVQAVVSASGEIVLATPSDSGIVYVNTADQAALESLPRVGPELARRIIAYREEHGSFTAPEDLLEVNGIGPALLEAITPLISFEIR